jgi:nucleotide-binding universal stress UspA family protein
MEKTGECILRSAVTFIDIPASWLMEQWLYALDEGSVAYDAFSQNLFPVDYSDATTATVPAVKEIAQRFDSTITVLNAFNLVRECSLAPNVEGIFYSEPAAIPDTQPLRERRDRREQRLEEFTRTQFSNISHSERIEEGAPAMVIEWTARRENADLIMTPTKGLGLFRRLLLGSVISKVLYDVSCPGWPVLTILTQPRPCPAVAVLSSVLWN